MSKHATIKLGNYKIPLIGVPEDAALQECSLCHDLFGIQDVELNGTQFLCKKCKGTDERTGPKT